MNDTPGIAERYSSACRSSNLRVETNRGSSADVLIAAGWSRSSMGTALMRLQGEWDAAEKPRKPKQEEIDALATRLPPYANGGRNYAEARATLKVHHVIELRVMLGKLKTLPAVRAVAINQARRWRIADPIDLVSKVLLHWLDHRCLLCGGTGEQPVKGASMLSGKECRGCSGSGMTECPGGADGRRLASWFDQTVTEAQSTMKHILHRL